MSKHTPGPWHVFDNREDSSFERFDPARLGVGSKLHADIAHCYGHDSSRTDDETIANAKLIAAAPELLEALKDATEALAHLEERMAVRVNPPTLAKARAALAKAE